ncbi:MAG: putative aminohydrolase SsnA [Anaerolineae bacterium]|nr:putative aminohydrolase SsnA [Thermoflexales bacterium]MDW8407845.1 putative aminohydrolase SsnA [Anaerolineae bacterium]
MLIVHGLLITMSEPNQVIEDGAVLVRDGLIADLGPSSELLGRHGASESEIIDCRSSMSRTPKPKVILPANICAHTHFYGAFARGMAIPGAPAINFVEILEKLWWRLDLALDLEAVKYSALVCLIDAIKHGTTTLVDHHASPNAIDGSLDVIAEAVEQAGLRAALCYEVTDRNGMEGAWAGIEENARFARRAAQHGSARVRAAVGIHASFTVSDATLDACVSVAKEADIPLHLHVAEDQADQDDALSKYDLRVIERLDARGSLTHRTLCAHCVHIDEREIDLLAQSGAKVIHQPRSNMNNGVGVAPVEAMLEAGVCVGLGNDGFSNDAFAEMKVADMIQKLGQRNPRAMGADVATKLAYTNNARIAQLFWPELTGTLEIGAPADLILMDYTPFTPLHAGNVPWHMLFGMSGGMVTDTLCNGRWLMRERRLLTLDEAEICAKARELAVHVWERI